MPTNNAMAESVSAVRTVNDVLVTPEQAAMWLMNAAPNRAVRRAKVASIVQQIKSGVWHNTHQSIAFDKNGQLVDGRHRLTAIVEAGVAAIMQISYYNKTAAEMAMGRELTAIDTGTSRNVGDMLNISGMACRQCIGRTMLIMHSLHNDFTMGRPSAGEVVDFALANEDMAYWLIDACKSNTKKIMVSSVMAAIGRAYYHVDRTRLLEFCEVLSTGIVKDVEADIAAIRLREYLFKHRPARNVADTVDRYKKTERAIQAFCNRQYLVKLFACDNMLYPMPADALPVKMTSAA